MVPRPCLVAQHARAHGTCEDRVVIGTMMEPPMRLQPWVRWEARTPAEQYRAMQAGKFAPTPWQLYTGMPQSGSSMCGGREASTPPGTALRTRLAHGLRLQRVAAQLCGAVFNLVYWMGVADKVGSARVAPDLADLGSQPGLLTRPRSTPPIGSRGGRQ